MNTKKLYRDSKFLLCIIMIIMLMAAPFAHASTYVSKIADASSLNQWKQYFGENVSSTANSGAVWTDKSVFTDAETIKAELGITGNLELTDPENFLAALSVIASNKSVKGHATIPTDTVFVLDMSGSMTDKNRLINMVPALNSAMAELMELNIANRVSVVLYYGTDCDSSTVGFGPAPADSSHVLLPLGRYQSVNGEYVHLHDNTSVTGRHGKYTVSVVAKTESGAAVPANAFTLINYSTYIQNGLLAAWEKVFKNADVTVSEGDSLQIGQYRMPVLVLMTDGAPNAITHNYTKLEAATGGNSVIRDTNNEIGFLTQLSAAYVRSQMKAHYNPDGRGHQPLVYTLGLDLEDVTAEVRSVVEAIMNPITTPDEILGWWDSYSKGNSLTLTLPKPGVYSSTNPYTVNVTVPASNNPPASTAYNYVNKYFEANGSDQLNAAFDSIVEEIILQSLYYPTDSEIGQYDHDGYVTFVDHLGTYMQVKDIKGFVLDDKLYTGAGFAKYLNAGSLGTPQNPTSLGDEFIRSVRNRLDIDRATAQKLVDDAFNDGQLYYTSDSDYGNSICWYADQNGNYLRNCTSLNSRSLPANAKYRVTSYGFLEDAYKHGLNSNLMYVSVQVRTEIKADGTDGDVTLVMKVPASLVPVVSTELRVETIGDGQVDKITYKRTMRNPLRLLYEVGLRDDINAYSVTDICGENNKNADGSYTFYTNLYNLEEVNTLVENNVAEKEPGEYLNTMSYFSPSKVNERYYFLRNTPLYIKNPDGSYSPFNGPSLSGQEIYVPHGVYNLLSDGTADPETHFDQIRPQSIQSATKDGEDYWYLPVQTVLRRTNDNIISKEKGDEITPVEYVALPIIHSHGNSSHAATILGNNGSITIMPKTADVMVQATKQLITTGSITHGLDGFEFELLDTSGNVVDTAISDENGIITFGLDYDASDIGKTYYYIAREKAGLNPRITYSTQEFMLRVDIVAHTTDIMRVLPQWTDANSPNNIPQFVNYFDGSIPPTGDNAPLMLLIAMCLISLAGVVFFCHRSFRKI